jgi:protein-S-isoprenylcysteine O-methyltransferase Ste14
MNDAELTPVVREGPSATARRTILFSAIAASVAFMLVGYSRWPIDHVLHQVLILLGLGLIMICIIGRTWCALYIGGVKNQSLVTDGPYSICRNPLYLFSIIGTTGVACLYGSIVVTLFIAFLAWANFAWWANCEEGRLLTLFGEDYRRYHDRVPRFLPDFRQWRDRPITQIRPRAVVNTFADSLFLLIAIPVSAAFEYLHEIGVLSTYIALP